MPARRILSAWFPHLGAERLLRHRPDLAEGPFAVADERGQAQVLSSVSPRAARLGLYPGQPLRDAHAISAQLVTHARQPRAEAGFLTALARWAEGFSPWVAPQPPDALMLDITGCAHLFGGEEAMAQTLTQQAADLGLTARCGLADTPGAAWALARYGDATPHAQRTGDAIDQEARATRSRAAKRRAAPSLPNGAAAPRIAPPGQAHSALAPLPVAALRLPPEITQGLARLGLRCIGDLLGQPRAPLARRFGPDLTLRLDQAMGAVPEPISPAKPPPRFAVRLTFPDPIGLRDDLLAALDRMVPRLCQGLRDKGQGARHLRLDLTRCDGTGQSLTAGLASASHSPDQITPLLAMKLDQIDAGFGIDLLRLEATGVEPIHARQTSGHAEAAARARQHDNATAIDDLMTRIGARVGLDQITRQHPADSHIPEKTTKTMAAAWSSPAGDWPAPPRPRPLLIWRPEPVLAPDRPALPEQFRWRGQTHAPAQATGPERIAPEWWLDDPNWRSGTRDYWHVITTTGARLWLFYAHGGALSSGWFCQGRFA
ncbi:DNA polymerase Y family protein [uncultured Roseovarius sp.]|uniref:Y-family DNA polymerase n=1 Tax=uncultured Roseovarius sp. TaxID=293344 RepID=UPI0025DD49EC|nr:DNA polymerase Y family protein [uncultured Roseovarius sp.]